MTFSGKYLQFWLPEIVSNSWLHHKLQDLYCISSWVTSLEMNMIQVRHESHHAKVDSKLSQISLVDMVMNKLNHSCWKHCSSTLLWLRLNVRWKSFECSIVLRINSNLRTTEETISTNLRISSNFHILPNDFRLSWWVWRNHVNLIDGWGFGAQG